MKITKKDLDNERQNVRKIYDKYGFNSPEYIKAFDALHDLCINYSIQVYRTTYGFSEYYNNTPYH